MNGSRQPELRSAALRMAIAAHSRGDLAAAEPLYRQALDEDAACFEALHNLGHVLMHLDRPAEALVLFERALALRPDAPATHNMLAQALRRQERYDAAIEHHRRAIALRPGYAQAHHDLGRLLQGLGRIDEARASLEAALALAPGRGEYYRSLGELTRFGPDDPRLKAMEALVRDAARMPLADRIELHYALAKAWADLGRTEAAFGQYAEGARLLRVNAGYDEAGTLGQLTQMARTFTPELMRAKAGLGHPSAQPVFILGMPRSGSTLIEQILAGCPGVSAGGELSAFRDAAAASLSSPEAAVGLDAQGLAALGGRYLERAGAVERGAVRFTDKMPGNFLLLGLIHLALPNARIIHTVREPVDTCFSGFTTLFLDGHPYSNDLAELGRYWRAYDQLMAHWRTVLPPGVMLEVRYEEVVADLEGQARRMVEHCGLGWDPACLDVPAARRGVWTASAAQVRRPVHADSVGRWRPYRPWLGPLIEALGPNGQT